LKPARKLTAKDGMKAFRIVIAALLVGCAVPVAVFAAALAISVVSGCTLQFKGPHVCSFAAMDIGWLLDEAVRIGVWGGLSFGLGVYFFAAWTLVELGAVVLVSLRRG
jgi:hypothetical protein